MRLSELRPIVRRARFLVDYVQGTMGLEGQGLDRDQLRKLMRRSVREAIAARTQTTETPAERQWYERHGATHAHCPEACEHPQERMLSGRMVCGRCLVISGRITPVLPCVPGVCD